MTDTRPATTPTAAPRGAADGQPITGPAYTSWDRHIVTTPTEITYARSRESTRLEIAARLYAAAMSPTTLDAAPGRLIDRALEHADKLLSRNDAYQPATPSPTPFTSAEPSLSLNAVRLLSYMRLDANAPLLPFDEVTGLDKGQVAAARRELLKAGYAAFSTPEGSIVLTDEGRALLFV